MFCIIIIIIIINLLAIIVMFYLYFSVLSEADLMAMRDIKKICQSALFTVLRQEIDRFNNLLQIIHKCLQQLIQAIKGEVVMSEVLEDAYSALLQHRVPGQWKVCVCVCVCVYERGGRDKSSIYK